MPGGNKNTIGTLVENVRDVDKKFLSHKLMNLFKLPDDNESVRLTRKVAKTLIEKNVDISDLDINFDVVRCPLDNIPSVGKSLATPNNVYITTQFLKSTDNNEDMLAFRLANEISRLKKKHRSHQKDFSYRLSGLKYFMNSVGLQNAKINFDLIEKLLVSSKCVADEFEYDRLSLTLMKNSCYNVFDFLIVR
jgi:hypothetical protein